MYVQAAGADANTTITYYMNDGTTHTQTYNIPANRMFFLNSKYLHFRPHRDRNFVPIGGDRQSVNQDAIVRLIGWAGNLTCSGGRYHGVLAD